MIKIARQSLVRLFWKNLNEFDGRRMYMYIEKNNCFLKFKLERGGRKVADEEV